MNVTCPNCATIYRVDPAKVPESGVRARCAVCNAVFPVRRDMELARSEARPSPAAAPAASAPTPKVEPASPQQPRLDPVRHDPPRPEPRPEPRTQPTPTPPPPREPVRAAEPARAPTPAATPPSMPPGGPPRPAAAPRPANPFTRPAAAPTSGSAGVAPAAPAAPAAPVRPAAPGTPAGVAASPPVAGPQASGTAAPAPRPAGSPGVRPPNPFLSQDPALKAKRLARALISDMVVYHPGKRQEGLRDGNLKELFEEEIKKSWEEYAEQVGREVAESTTYFREALNEILAGGRPIF
jgi:predicted Zn finger-like uncharacterized protein